MVLTCATYIWTFWAIRPVQVWTFWAIRPVQIWSFWAIRPVQIVFFYTSGLDICGLFRSSTVWHLHCLAHIVQYVDDNLVHHWWVTNLLSSLSSKSVGGGLLMLMNSLAFHVSFFSSRALVINLWIAATTLLNSRQCSFLYGHSVLHKPWLWNQWVS